jgi:hypothetical protein
MEVGSVGDKIIVESEHVGEAAREGEILEVLARGDDVHYFVRWEDGRRTTLFPSAGSIQIIHPARTQPKTAG